jgi:signal transduction histidine kinase
MLVSDAELRSTSKQKVYLEKILRSAHSMETLISDILKLSHLSLAPIEEEFVSLGSVFEETLLNLADEIRRSNGNIEIRKPLATVRANRTLLVQVFANLIGNALKFTRPGESPEIEIFIEEKDGYCEIHVRDSGLGIPEEYQQKIFTVFERGSAPPSTGGTGIGLAIVKKAIERLGGNIRVISKQGQGSDFVVSLPCQVEQDTVAGK